MQSPRFVLAALAALSFTVSPVFAQYDDEDDPPPGGGPPEIGKGVIVDVAVSSNVFTNRDIVINVGDTVRWSNTGGFHNVVADDDSFTSGAPSGANWVFEFTFTQEFVGVNPYYCVVHGGPGGIGMAGTVTVNNGFEINFGITGSWFNPLTNGQGWLFEVVPGFDPAVMVAYNFTFPPAPIVKGGGEPEFFGNQMWLVGAGNVEGNTVTVEANRPFGGFFDDPTPPEVDEAYATFIFTFFDCFNGMVEYTIPEKGLSGKYDIERITPDVLCEDLATPP